MNWGLACRIGDKWSAIANWLTTQFAAFDCNLLICAREVGGWSWPMVRGSEESAPFEAVDLWG
ncbi:MAG: hypothetical protein DMG88_09365 [Acidobacteria bacterium]|nr:MAG: hypothetical protein DMG88_09365 [Acidobacteriota bacterium]